MADVNATLGTTPSWRLHEKKRRYPRVVINAPMDVLLGDGSRVKAIAYDISEDGIQMRCDRPTASKVHPSERPLDEDERPAVRVRLSLPLHSGKLDLVAECALQYFAFDTEDGTIAFGLRFRRLGHNGEQVLKSFISAALVPA